MLKDKLRSKMGLLNTLRIRQAEGWSYYIAKKLVFSKVKERLGLDRCRLIGVGAAPLAVDTLEYFLSLDIPMCEGYGMSETMGPHTGHKPGSNRIGSVGLPLGGMRFDILSPGEDGTGEVILCGRNRHKDTARIVTKLMSTKTEIFETHS